MNQEILQTYLRQEETPAYIFDLDMLKSRVQMMKTILGERAEICFEILGYGGSVLCNESQSISDRTVKGYGR